MKLAEHTKPSYQFVLLNSNIIATMVQKDNINTNEKSDL